MNEMSSLATTSASIPAAKAAARLLFNAAIMEPVAHALHVALHLTSALELGQALAAINCGYFGARGAMQASSIRGLNQQLGKLLRDRNVTNSSNPTDLPKSALAPPDYCRTCIATPTTGDSDQASSTS